MIIRLKSPKKIPGQSESARLRELEKWADQITDQLNILLSNIGEQNLSRALKVKINKKTEE